MSFQNETPIRILAIAPYESMKVSLVHAAEHFPGISMDVYTGDLEEGVSIVKSRDTTRYDVILSRGGTAGLIREVTDLPVVEISVSVYDVLRTIKLSENYTDQFAVVGFPAVTGNAHTLCNLLRIVAPIVTVHDAQEAASELDRLIEQGIRTVICDKVSYVLARMKGLNALLMTSGENSIQQALEEAVAQGQSFRRIRNENLFLRCILSRDSRQCLVFNESKELVYAFQQNVDEEMLKYLQHRIAVINDDEENLTYRQIGGVIHSITGSTFVVQDQRYYLFRIQSGNIPLPSRHPGIRAYDVTECENLFMNSFFSISGSMGTMKPMLDSMAASGRPVMIMGEMGTGKEQIARYLYLNSRFRTRPQVVVDGEQLGDRGWSFLLENHASPMNSAGITVYFQHLEKVPVQHQHALLSLLTGTGISRRLRLIFSCDEEEETPLPEFIRQLMVSLGPLSLNLPTLRSRRDEIPALSSVYLGNLNEELGKQLSGFEPGAMNMLVNYDWPGNYAQFKHVLQELTVVSTGLYISTNDMAEMLARERRIYRRKYPPEAKSFAGKTLEEINRAIAEEILEENGGNQSLTAKQLGIGRTTLWRMLGKSDPRENGKDDKK